MDIWGEDSNNYTCNSDLKDEKRRKKKRKARILKILRVYDTITKKRPKRYRQMPPRRSICQLTHVTEHFHEYEIQKYLRMNKKTFYKLIAALVTFLKKPWKARGNAYYRYVPIDIRIVLGLRLLAGCEIIDLQASFCLPRCTIYVIVEEVIDAINLSFSLDGIATTVEDLCEVSQSFKTSRKYLNPLTGCVGAIDGIAIKIDKPRRVRNPSSYYCRKGFHALPVQAICDGRYRFLWFSCLSVGSSHDSLALALSRLGNWMKDRETPEVFWIAGDEGYACKGMIITPFTARLNQDISETNFNYFLSSYRVHIEQSFGMLVSKWRILRKKLTFTVRKSIRVISACMKLHNFVIENDTGFDRQHCSSLQLQSTYESSLLWYCEERVAMRWVKRRRLMFDDMEELRIEDQQDRNDPSSTDQHIKTTAVNTREKLKIIVKEHGMERPAVPLLHCSTRQ